MAAIYVHFCHIKKEWVFNRIVLNKKLLIIILNDAN